MDNIDAKSIVRAAVSGLHAGEGEGEARERGVVGETPNLAVRLQAIAKPGGIVVAESAVLAQDRPVH